MFSNTLPARLLLSMALLLSMSGCAAVMVTGAVVSTAASLAVEVVELPFEVAGATYDLVTDDDDEDSDDDDS
jgi:hypothetical protein